MGRPVTHIDRHWQSHPGHTAGLPGAASVFRVAGVMVDLRRYVFILWKDVMVLRSLPPRGSVFNPSWLLIRAPLCAQRFSFIHRSLSARRPVSARIAELGSLGGIERASRH